MFNEVIVPMNARMLRELMGETFDWEENERGRRDTRIFKAKHSDEEIADKIDEVKQILGSERCFKAPGPSYWIGCMAEFSLNLW